MTELKKCTKCLVEKPTSEFYKNKYSKNGFTSNCVLCIKEYKLLNKGKIKEQLKGYNKKRKESKKKWALKNKDKVNESRKKWTNNNKEKRSDYLKEYNKKYYNENKTIRLEYSKRKQKEYRKTNPLYRVKSNLRRRINRYLKSKSESTENILGISYSDFMVYIQNKFTEGMTLDKLGRDIHIDHIIPLSSAKTEDELYKLCHYTNLQPLWAKDNLKKSNKPDYLLENE
jgi:hypothetical protein